MAFMYYNIYAVFYFLYIQYLTDHDHRDIALPVYSYYGSGLDVCKY